MKNLILTLYSGAHYEKVANLTLPTIQAYANKIGADFLALTDHTPEFITQKWNKFKIHDLLNEYRRIAFFDIDIIIRDDTPDIFQIVPEDKLGMFNEGGYSERFSYLKEASDFFQIPIDKWNGKFYNSGVMVVSRKHKQLFKLPPSVDIVQSDQVYLNLKICSEQIDMFDLSYKYNRMDLVDTYCGMPRHDSFIIHYAGGPHDIVLPVIQQDIETWKQDRPHYKYTQKILIAISGGIGDQLSAEPAVRHIKKLYPDSDIKLITHHPRLFEHLDLPIYDYKNLPKTDSAVLTMYTCPEEQHAGHKLSHVMFHPVDYSSICTVRKILPIDEKNIQLKIDPADLAEIDKILSKANKDKPLVLIHAGKWWPSKTFPIEWWQHIIDKLSTKLTIGLIGKTLSEKQGYLPVTCPEDGVDFRDLTTLGEYIALLHRAKALISNDSSPIHIAGAFDNWIVVIPTCKHPDHILPYRKGSQSYKTKAIYSKLLLDDLETRHTELNINTIDELPQGKTVRDYLPDPDEVVQAVLKIYEQSFSE